MSTKLPISISLGLAVMASVMLALKLQVLAIPIVATILLVIFTLTNLKSVSQIVAVSLVGSIMLLPRVSVGVLTMRFEDYLFLFMVVIFGALMVDNRNPLTPRISEIPGFKIALFYLVYCLLFTSVAIFSGRVRPIYSLFLEKEAQYMFYFLFICTICRKYELENKVFKAVTVIFLATILYGVYQMMFTANGYYGIGIISEYAPSQSGGAFLVISLFFLYLFDKGSKHKFICGVLFLLSSLLTLATVSRTSITALAVCAGLYLVYMVVVSKKRLKNIVFAVASSFVGAVIYLFFRQTEIYTMFSNRMSSVSEESDLRMGIWKERLYHFDTFDYLFGRGKGYAQEVTGGFTLSADSQYARLIMEIGIVGLIMWVFIIFALLWFAIKSHKVAPSESLFLILLITGFLVMGVTHEVFMVSIQASLFWLMTGLFTAKILIKKNETI